MTPGREEALKLASFFTRDERHQFHQTSIFLVSRALIAAQAELAERGRPVKEQIARYDERMDPECVELCDAINSLPGLSTFESCWGHGVQRFSIWFGADSIESLRPILTEIHGNDSWTVSAHWASGGDSLYFWLAGRAGEQGLRMAEELAMCLRKYSPTSVAGESASNITGGATANPQQCSVDPATDMPMHERNRPVKVSLTDLMNANRFKDPPACQCGKKLMDRWNYCPNCGVRLEWQ